MRQTDPYGLRRISVFGKAAKPIVFEDLTQSLNKRDQKASIRNNCMQWWMEGRKVILLLSEDVQGYGQAC
jgi:hypothetical protein